MYSSMYNSIIMHLKQADLLYLGFGSTSPGDVTLLDGVNAFLTVKKLDK